MSKKKSDVGNDQEMNNTADYQVKKKKTDVHPDFPTPFHQLIGQKITDIQTLGKEFFMIFAECDLALRVHFLMSGSFRLNNENLDKDWIGSDMPDSMTLLLDKDVVTFRKSAYQTRNATECVKKVETMKHLDICASVFSQSRAVDLIKLHGSRQVADVLLDQEILPGVGNIIKNEAMFDSGIRPSTKISELNDAHLSFLVKMTRDFSLLFYKCRRDNKALYPFLHIYRKGKCGQCQGKTVTTKMGDDSARLTTYCPNCQVNDLKKVKKMTVPSKNSLLGWVQGASDSSEVKEWTCSFCTLENKELRKTCEACLNPREKGALPKTTSISDGNIVENTMGGTNSVVKEEKRKLSADDSEETSIEKKRTRRSLAPALIPFKPLPSFTVSKKSEDIKPETRNYSPISIEKCTGAPKPVAITKTLLIEAPVCDAHKKKCVMKTVHKAGPNNGRVFYACAQKQEKNCQYFKWADDKFPRCEAHDKIAVLRTVFKEGPNNGRKFFSCPLKKKSCGFFLWADS